MRNRQKGDLIKEALETSCRQINANDSVSRYRCNHVEGRDNGVSITGPFACSRRTNRPIDDRRLKADPAGVNNDNSRGSATSRGHFATLPSSFFAPLLPLLRFSSLLRWLRKEKGRNEGEGRAEREERIGNRWRESLARSIVWLSRDNSIDGPDTWVQSLKGVLRSLDRS